MSKISRREFNKKMTIGLAGAAAMGKGVLAYAGDSRFFDTNKKPNFVFVCSDQHSAIYNGFSGHPFIKTPNLDRIANNGVVFNSAYCGSPLCAPGRASMMTGMYSSDVNSFCNTTIYDGSYPTWGKRMRDSGYNCWAVGKQDLNPEIDLGFKEVNVEHGHATKPDITSLFRRPLCYRVREREDIEGGIREKPHNDYQDAQIALNFIRKESKFSEKPWTAFVGFRQPHPSWTGLEKYYDYYLSNVKAPDLTIKDLEELPLPYQSMRNFKRISTPIPDERIKRARAAYFSMVSELDEYVGMIYNSLEETDQIDNTYFIYTSDHGESLGEHGMWYKNNLYDHTAKIPLVISGPGIPKEKKIDIPVSHVDLVATMLDLAGMEIPNELRGTSLKNLINGENNKGPDFVYSESHSEGNPTGSFMIRKGDWKLINFSYYEDYLFNLKEDPGEKVNLINDPSCKNILEELLSILVSQVDPNEITERAFSTQKIYLHKLTDKMNEEEIVELLQRRLGDGQARNFAKMIIGERKV